MISQLSEITRKLPVLAKKKKNLISWWNTVLFLGYFLPQLFVYDKLFFQIFKPKCQEEHYVQELNINFFFSNMHHYIWDGMTKNKLYLWSKLTNV